MTAAATSLPTGSVPRHALRRGTRGFAAFVLFLTGMAVLAVAFLVLPGSGIDPQLLTVLVPLAIAFGTAHLVAIVGVIRRRAWVVPLSLYLLAIGSGIVGFGLILLRAGIDPVAGTAVAGDAAFQTAGLLLWLAGSWLVSARFTVRGMAGPDRAPAEHDEARAIELATEASRRRGVFPMVAHAR
jgi:hypothetical protein